MGAIRTCISKLNLPGMPEDASESERSLYISSVIPFEQSLVIYSLGALLDYMQPKFKNLYRHDSLIITNVNVCQLDDQLLMDLSTFYGLQIFSPTSNPNSKESKRYLTLYNLLNQCVSAMGSNVLREIMMMPTRDLNELNLRLNTVEWLSQKQNFNVVVKFRRHLRKIRNLSLLSKRITTYMGKAEDVKLMKSSIYYAYLICEECSKATGTDGTLLQTLGDYTTKSHTIKGVLFALDKVVDLVASEKEDRFIVKIGLDEDLDRKKDLLTDIEKSIYAPEQTKRLGLPSFIHEYYLIFLPGVGFVVAVELENRDASSVINSSTGEPLDLLFRKDQTIYFKTAYCNELNEKYGDLYGDICCHEKRIFDRLVKYLLESLSELISINKFCAKLDCLISFASVSLQRQYVKPKIVTTRGLFIKQGRHPLIETRVPFIPNDTNINETNDNLITILSAPNASGKSAYMKQTALIAYMAHIGCFVPAEVAEIGLLDAIYTRIYCPESVHQDESSYFSDLKQMSHVLNKGTTKSLVLIDEFGKGTNVREGQALLAACIENMAARGKDSSITIITTHFLEVLKLLTCDNITLKTIRTIQNEEGFRSLYELVDGYTSPNVSDYNETNALFKQMIMSGERAIDVNATYYTLLISKFAFARCLLHIFKKDKNLDMKEIFELLKNATLKEFI
ncbi:mutS protein homolog 5-like [Culicoides brevitarsis]|uniref:mutS protein homolog 5-like n=1 Tax=Culicoides brevitarsis TaxID=469753 RepID=UPI00307BBD96